MIRNHVSSHMLVTSDTITMLLWRQFLRISPQHFDPENVETFVSKLTAHVQKKEGWRIFREQNLRLCEFWWGRLMWGGAPIVWVKCFASFHETRKIIHERWQKAFKQAFKSYIKLENICTVTVCINEINLQIRQIISNWYVKHVLHATQSIEGSRTKRF